MNGPHARDNDNGVARCPPRGRVGSSGRPFGTDWATRTRSVVALHASASSARQWQPLAAALAPRFRVHAVDLHGHGERSPWRGARALSLADEAALLAPLVRREGDVHLVGHSYGGAVALKTAAMYPRHVRSVTVYEPVMFRWLVEGQAEDVGDVLGVVDTIRRELAFGSAFEAGRAFVDFWSGEGAWHAMAAPRRASIAARMRSVASHFAALLLEPLALREVARLCIPTMVLTGARTVRVMHRLAATLRGALQARHRAVAGAGHMGPITHAEAVNREIAAFLDECDRRAAGGEPATAMA
jgi:pimeloyl-ACP methyl ester carboxylesterase